MRSQPGVAATGTVHNKRDACCLLAFPDTGDRFAGRRPNYGSRSGGNTDSFNRSSQFAAGRRDTMQEADGYQGSGAYGSDGPDDPSAAFMSRDGSEADGSSSCLSVFVEVHFRGKRQRTSAVDSNAPIWNEQVRVHICVASHKPSALHQTAADVFCATRPA